MNYFYVCKHCKHEHLIEVTVAKGQPIATSDIPDSCLDCGAVIPELRLQEEIDQFVKDTIKQNE